MVDCIRIYFGFSALWLLYYTCSYPAFPFVFYSTCLLLLSDHTMSLPCLISFVVYLLAPACFCSWHDFQCMFMIRIYRYTCAYLRTPFGISIPLAGEFWLPWILMSRSRSLKLVDSPSCWSEMCSDSVDQWKTIWGPILPGPLLGSRVFLLWLWASFLLFILVYLFVFS